MSEAPVKEEVVIDESVTERRGGLLNKVVFRLDLLSKNRELAGKRVLLIATEVGRNESLHSSGDSGVNKGSLSVTHRGSTKGRDNSIDAFEGRLEGGRVIVVNHYLLDLVGESRRDLAGLASENSNIETTLDEGLEDFNTETSGSLNSFMRY
jgi:hypothetical protein